MKVKDIKIGEKYAVSSGFKWGRKSLEELAERYPDEIRQLTVTRIERRKPTWHGEDSHQVIIDVYGCWPGNTQESYAIQPFQIRGTWEQWLELRGPVVREQEAKREAARQAQHQRVVLDGARLHELRQFFPFGHLREDSSGFIEVRFKAGDFERLREQLQAGLPLLSPRFFPDFKPEAKGQPEDPALDEWCERCRWQGQEGTEGFEHCVDCGYTIKHQLAQGEQPDGFEPIG